MLAMPATRSASSIEPAVIAVVASCPRAIAPAAVPTAANSAISSRPGTEASMPAATCPISPGCASRLVEAAAVRAAACACAMTCLHCAVTARAQTSGIRGLASAPRALFAPPQVMSRQKAMMASPVPHTSGLISLRSSAASSHGTCVLLPRDLQVPVFQPGPLDGHRFGDHPARHQDAVHVPAAVVLDKEL